MISVDSLLYKIDQKLNMLASAEHQGIPVEDKILVLNEAQLKLIKQKIDVNNIFNLGFDAFLKRYEDLQVLVEPYNKVKITEKKDKLNTWTADISDLSPRYMMYVSAYLDAKKGSCSGNLTVSLVKHRDLQLALQDEFSKPSFEWEQTIGTISKNSIEIYTGGDFIINDLYLSYLRYPAYIDKEGYEHLDGTTSKTQNCELPSYLEDELVDLAVQELAITIDNKSIIEASQLKIKEEE